MKFVVEVPLPTHMNENDAEARELLRLHLRDAIVNWRDPNFETRLFSFTTDEVGVQDTKSAADEALERVARGRR